MRSRLPFVAVVLALGCGAERRAAERPRTSLISELTLAPAYLTPAVWRYHPPEHARVTASRELGDGRTLFVGKRGERWIYNERTRRLDAGSALAPEDLIAILKLDSGGWAFVGASGTSYEARSPLGAFFRSSAPLDPLIGVAAAGRIIVGVKRDRSLLRSADAGASWQAVGPAKKGFIDVELTDKGQGLALAVPEALYSSTDEGVSWAPVVGVPKLGALSLDRAEDGTILIGTALGPRKFAVGEAQPLKPVLPDPAEKKDPLGNPARGPSATAIVEGRALITGSQYLELAPPMDRTGSWRLFKGPLDGKLEVNAVAELKGCRAVRLAAFDRFVTVACFRGAGENATQPVEFLRSETRGDTWDKEPFTAEGSLSSLRLAMGSAGSLIVTGICPSGASGSGCGPLGVFHRRPARAESGSAKPAKALREAAKAVHRAATPSLELAASATPSLADVAMALAFSPDGRYAYAVGRRTKTGALAIFVSRDGGASFEAEDLGLVPAGADEEVAEERWERASSALRVESLSVAEDGALALVLTRRRAATLIVLDEEGRVVSTANAPDERSMIGAAGMRALALSPGSRDVWESLDGGGSWNPLGRFPLELCKDEDNCYVPVRCAALGCAIGHEISRIGWGGQAEDEGGLLPPPAVYTPDFAEKRLRTSIACSLDEGAWRPLAGVRSVPTAYESGIGRAIWYAAAVDENTGSVAVLEALSGSRRIETRSLLRPSARPESLALVALDQVEGVAALRYQVPEVRDGEARLRNVEIAWANVLEGKVGQARIADGGAYAPGDYTRGNGRTQRAAPGLLSIAEGGLYVRLHQAAGDKQDTLFVDGTSVATVPPLEWPAAIAKTGRSEMAHLGGVHVPLFLIAGGRAVVRADRSSGAWSFAATSTGLADPAKFGLVQDSTISYSGGRAGLHVEVFDPSSMTAEGRIFPFRASGDAVDGAVNVPTQLSLTDRPGRCGPAERQNTPRVVAPFRPGTRHAVIVSEGTEPPRTYLTVLSVLHGTPENACAVVLDAEPAPSDPPISARAERVILPVDDLEHAYLFRVGQSPGTELTRIEYRTMNCRFDPGAEVPPEVYRAPGTSVPRH